MFCNPIEDRESFQDIYMHADEQRKLQCAQEAPNPIDYSDAFAVAEGKIEGNNMKKDRKKRKIYIYHVISSFLQNLFERRQNRRDEPDRMKDWQNTTCFALPYTLAWR